MRIIFYILLVLMVSFVSDSKRRRVRRGVVSVRQLDGNDPPICECAVARFLASEFEKMETISCNKQAVAEWNHLTDLDNEKKERLAVDTTVDSATLDKLYWNNYFHRIDPRKCSDPSLARQIERLSVLGNAALTEKDLRQLTNIISNMTKIYSTAKVITYETRDQPICLREYMPLDSGIIDIMAESDNTDVLKYYWQAWRDATGAKMKPFFDDYVYLSNKAAKLNGFQDKGDMWRYEFEEENFERSMEKLWAQVKPLYDELQEYVLNRIREKYGDTIDEGGQLLPAHILGNVWAQNWLNIAPYVLPFPKEEKINVTRLLQDKDFTVLKMFETADTFYRSLGLEPNDMCYDVSKGAMIEKPCDGRNVLCHASAWDFCDGKDFRIKMCTEVNFENFVIIHHEMGHIEYYQLYKNQPFAFRNGANPGFHEAIGDTIALSVTTPRHLARIGLLDGTKNSSKADINALMYMALERVAFLPYAYLLEKWRWDVFSGNVDPENWNVHYWKYRETIQKVSAPVERSDEFDFDPGAKFHIVADSQYISYFFAHILQFQLHKALCIAAKEYSPGDPCKPLHKCDIFESKEAGNLLRKGLSMGSSVHWTDVLEEITGTRKLSGEAILEYFKPLYDFLVKENNKFAVLERKK